MEQSIKLIQLFISKVSTLKKKLKIQLKKIFHLTGREVLPAWDRQIQSLCYQVNNIMEKIATSAPEWMNRALDEQMVH